MQRKQSNYIKGVLYQIDIPWVIRQVENSDDFYFFQTGAVGFADIFFCMSGASLSRIFFITFYDDATGIQAEITAMVIIQNFKVGIFGRCGSLGIQKKDHGKNR